MSTVPSPTTKAGRGGAGNFHSRAAVENAENQALDTSSRIIDPAQQQQRGTYQRQGRGGAGNFVDEEERENVSAAASKQEKGLQGENTAAAIKDTAASTASTTAPTYRGRSGRGGAGNWARVAEVEEEKRREAEEVARGEVDVKVRGEVDGGLRMPPRAYAGGNVGREDG